MASNEMSSNQNYENLYGVTLLDDVHNYFPALLYEPSSFSSLQELLSYVQRQTRERFDLFSYGQRQYRAANPPRQQQRSSFAQRSYSDAARGFAASNLSAAARSPLVLPVAAATVQNNDDLLTSAALQQLMTSLFSISGNRGGAATLTATLNGEGMEAFLEPVVVRPTPEQITQFTTVANLATDEEHSCAICQEVLRSEQEGRKLNACGHWFHRTCIDTWFQRHIICPICRHDIREPLAPRQ